MQVNKLEMRLALNEVDVARGRGYLAPNQSRLIRNIWNAGFVENVIFHTWIAIINHSIVGSSLTVFNTYLTCGKSVNTFSKAIKPNENAYFPFGKFEITLIYSNLTVFTSGFPLFFFLLFLFNSYIIYKPENIFSL